jgi:hypothetical protein
MGYPFAQCEWENPKPLIASPALRWFTTRAACPGRRDRTRPGQQPCAGDQILERGVAAAGDNHNDAIVVGSRGRGEFRF